jgi:hypothetical protein
VIVRKGWEGVKKGLQRTTEVHSRFADFGFGAIHICGYYLLNPGRLGIIQNNERTSEAISFRRPPCLASISGCAIVHANERHFTKQSATATHRRVESKQQPAGSDSATDEYEFSG